MANNSHTETNKTNESAPLKRCLFITPISNPGSEIRQLTDGIISAIRPILREFGYVLSASHEISTSGSINDQVIDRLINDDLVIANLTNFNPNVMYELAVRHCAAKPVVLIVRKDDNVPFDLFQERRIEYTDSITGGEDMKNDLRSALTTLTTDEYLNYNPVYKVAKLNLIEKNLKPGEDDFKNYILNGFQTLSQQLAQLSNTVGIGKSSLNSNNNLERVPYRYRVQYFGNELENPFDIFEFIWLAPSIQPFRGQITLAMDQNPDIKKGLYFSIESKNPLPGSVLNDVEMELQKWGFEIMRVA